MRTINEDEFRNVLSLDAPKRYKYFINYICDAEKVWGLYNDGWALAADNVDNSVVFPLWPAIQFAQECVKEEWSNYKPEMIFLDDLLNELFPNLKTDKMNVGVFYTPADKGVVLTIDSLESDILEEMKKY